jgi:hypothetical protein
MLIGACAPSGATTGNDNQSDNDNAPVNENGQTNENGARACGPSGENGATTVSYNADLVPLLARTGCLSASCHGGTFNNSEYDLQTYEGIFGPGDQAQRFGLCNVVPGDPDVSYLIEKLMENPREGLRMPQVGPPLTTEEIDLIRAWILEGAQEN